MFLAGLSFNFKAFKENRRAAIVYGLLGFAIPFGLSMWIGMSALGYGVLSAALVGAMWASNTLVAYPEVSVAGLQNNRAVSTAVAAGVEFDLMSLTVLAVATSTAALTAEPQPGAVATVSDPFLPLWAAIPLLAVFTLWFLPKITNWFFVEIGRTRMQRFVFALIGMSAGAAVAVLGGIEGLIGAFLAGLGMNSMIPIRGPLMERLDFVGSAIFVPAFLVSIGLNINPALLFDVDTLLLALLFTGIVVVGKAVPALITGRIFKFSLNESGLMASLSFGQAASTLAIAQVGVSLGLLTVQVVNAAVLTIVSTALLTSFGTRFFVRRLPRPAPPKASIGEHVLVDVRANGSDMEALMALAASIAQPDNGLVVPYAVPGPGEIDRARNRVDEATQVATSLGLDSDGLVRVDESFRIGTLNLIEQDEVSLVLLSWQGVRFPSDLVFGNDIDEVGEASPVPTMAAHLLRPWDRIIVVIGDTKTDWQKEDALLTLAAVRRIRYSKKTPLLVFTNDREFVEGNLGQMEDVEFEIIGNPRKLVLDEIGQTDLVIAPATVLRDAPVATKWRMVQALAGMNLVVVAGPRRMSISKGVTRRGIQSVVQAGM
jgi:Kef-type K+ transport system membrane component KefB